MKYLIILCLLLSTVSFADKLPFGMQRFQDVEECEEIIAEHNRNKSSAEFRKVGLWANKNVCIVITLDSTAGSERLAIKRFEEALDKSTRWKPERIGKTNFWRLVAK